MNGKGAKRGKWGDLDGERKGRPPKHEMGVKLAWEDDRRFGFEERLERRGWGYVGMGQGGDGEATVYEHPNGEIRVLVDWHGVFVYERRGMLGRWERTRGLADVVVDECRRGDRVGPFSDGRWMNLKEGVIFARENGGQVLCQGKAPWGVLGEYWV